MFEDAEAVRRSRASLDRELPGSESDPRREAPSHTRCAQAPGEALRSLGQARPRRALSRFTMNLRANSLDERSRMEDERLVSLEAGRRPMKIEFAVNCPN